MALDVAMIMRLVDRFTAPARKMEQSVDRIAQKTQKLERSGRAFDRIASGARRAGTVLNGVYLKAMEKAGHMTGRLIRRTGELALQWAKWGALGGAAAIGWMGGKFLTGIVDVGMQFEQFQAQLEGTEGSAEKAKASLDWVMKFAAKTPYAMDEVTDAFVRARGVGIDPFTGALETAGDAAAANRKTIMEAIEAIADAQTGEFERLKEFNITSSVKGNNVSFAFIDKDGKNAVKTVKKDMESIRSAVLEIWNARHAGGMIRQSKTLTGLWSNITDSVTMFQYKIGNAGWFNNLKEKAAQFLETLNRWQDSGKLDEWAKRISAKLEEMTNGAVDFVKSVDWNKVAEEAGRLAAALWKVAKALIDIVEIGSKASTVLSALQNPAIGGFAMADSWIGKVQAKAKAKTPAAPRYRSGDFFGKPYLKLPSAGKKTAMAPQQNHLIVDINTPAGTQARLRPKKLAANTTVNVGRAMGRPA